MTSSTNECPLVKYWDDDMLEKRIREEKINVLGLLYHGKEKGDLVDPVWLKENFQTELFRNLVVESIRMLKSQEEAALAAKRVVPSSTSRMPNKKNRMANTHNEMSSSKVQMPSLEVSDEERDEDENMEEGDGGLTCGPIVLTDEGHGRTNSLNQLYEYCTRKPSPPISKQEVLVSMCGYYLNHADTMSMKRRGQLCNNVVSLASAVFNDRKIGPSSKFRYYLSSYFMDFVKADLNNFMKDKLMPWRKLPSFFPSNNPSIIICDLIFAPVVYQRHWWCYVGDRREMILYVLDSLGSSHTGNMTLLDKLTVRRFEELLALIDHNLDVTDVKLQIQYPKVPKQPNGYDCGVHTIKYMEIWDGDTTYGGRYTMATWSEEEVAGIRQDLLTRWVLDERNEKREHVCCTAKVDVLLSTSSPTVLASPCYERIFSPRVEARGTFLFGNGNEDMEPNQVNETGVVKKATGNEGSSIVGKSNPKSNIGTRVKQKTYQRKQKPGLHQQTPYTASHLTPRKI